MLYRVPVLSREPLAHCAALKPAGGLAGAGSEQGCRVISYERSSSASLFRRCITHFPQKERGRCEVRDFFSSRKHRVLVRD